MKCKVCEKEFELKKENKYKVVTRKHKDTDMHLFYIDYGEAFDCPYCGCQNVVNRFCCERVKTEEPKNTEEKKKISFRW